MKIDKRQTDIYNHFMLNKKNKEPMPDFSDVNVKLKPIFGIKPGLYLTVLFSIILLLIIFMTLRPVLSNRRVPGGLIPLFIATMPTAPPISPMPWEEKPQFE